MGDREQTAAPATAAPQAAAPTTAGAGPAHAGPVGAVPGAPGGARLLGVQQSAGNAATLGLLGAQPKLVVGAADDAYEREADRIARLVTGNLAAGEVTADVAVTRRRSAPGAAGGEADPAVEHAISRSRGRGRPLDGATRTRMEGAFGTDFGGVRIHADGEADTLNRSVAAKAFTLGSDIWFRGGEYSPTTAPGQELLAHELTHVVQQSGGAGGVQRSVGVIQRHASWEHRMLSDVTPDALKVIVTGRDQAREDKAAAKKKPKKAPRPKDAAEFGLLEDSDEDVPPPLVALEVDGNPIDDAIHALSTEIDTLLTLRAKDADFMGVSEADAKAFAKAGLERAPHLTLVPVKLKNTWAVVTYGEINTLADYYGGVDEIGQTDPANFQGIIRGIRERELRGFTQLLGEVEGKTAAEIEKAKYADSLKFEGAIGDTGRKSGIKGVSDSDYAELQLMGKVPLQDKSKEKAGLAGQPESSYSAGLARNACHFAPYSWHAWADHHNRAVVLARQAFAKRTAAATHRNLADADKEREEKAALTAEADELLRQALVINGFGDHFLQDSFASGHLVNKTLIMKWFAKYLDQHKWDEDFSSAEEWRKIQATVYGQKETAFGTGLYDLTGGKVSNPSNDPQTAENVEGSWKNRFDALGLSVPASLRDPRSDSASLFTYWQDATKAKGGKKTYALTELVVLTHGSVPKGPKMQAAVLALVKDGVVYRETKHRTLIKDENVAKDTKQIGKAHTAPEAFHDDDTFTIRPEYVPKGAQVVQGAQQYEDASKKVVHSDFLTFLNHSYLQFATNVLHNKFCAEGLEVGGAAGPMFKVYGDNAMLEKGAADGVKFSAETARKSLQAIQTWSSAGQVPAELTVDAIAARFPSHVTGPDGAKRSIENWHMEGGQLQKLCNDVVFPSIASAFNFKSSAVGVGGTVADVVSRDVAAHDSTSF